MSQTEIGFIQLNSIPEECDEAWELIKERIEAARVYLKSGTVNGFIISGEEPGADDRDKLWCKTDACSYYWYYYSAGCGKWCPMNGIPGERVTRHRIEETVAEDVTKYYGCGWELADGTNSLSVDLRGTQPSNLGVYSVALNNPEYAVESITVESGSVQTVYSGLDDGTIYNTIADLAVALNTEFTSSAVPLTASEQNGCLKIVPDDPSDSVLSGVDGNGNALLLS